MTSAQSGPGNTTEASGEAITKPRRKGSVAPRSFRGRIGAGVLIIIPLAVTAILIRYVYNAALSVGVRLINWLSRAILWAFDLAVERSQSADVAVGASAHVDQTSPHWYSGLVEALSDAAENPPEIDPSEALWYQNLTAVVLTLLMLYLLGWLGTNVVGRRIIGFVEGLVKRIPLVATVYNAIKTMVQALAGGKRDDAAQQVVLVDFPHENMKAVAFMTNLVTDRVSKQEFATVYLPTTPNPTSGYMLMVPVDRITETDWTMEEALSMVLSGGAAAKRYVHLSPSKRSAIESGGAVDGRQQSRPGTGKQAREPG